MSAIELAGLCGLDLHRSVAVVTEVATHPGDEIARSLGRAGATVIALSKDKAAGGKLAADLRESGVDSVFIDADPNCLDEARDLLDEVHRRFARVDILVATTAQRLPGRPRSQSTLVAPSVFGEHFAARGHGMVITVGGAVTSFPASPGYEEAAVSQLQEIVRIPAPNF